MSTIRVSHPLQLQPSPYQGQSSPAPGPGLSPTGPTSARPAVLVIDDERGPRESLRMILKDEYEVLLASTPETAIELLEKARPAALLLDIRLGESDGIEVLRAIRQRDQGVQVAMVTAYASLETARLAMQLGAVDYLSKPFDLKNVRQVVASLVGRYRAMQEDTERVRLLQQANESLERTVSYFQDEIATNFAGTVEALITAIDAKDRFTRDHSARVSLIAGALGDELGMSAEEIRSLRTAGLIHDIGKIGISEQILRKPGRLTADEWLEMKKHPSTGAEIIARVPGLTPIVPGVLQHHERPDGRGYPAGLTLDQLSPMARIIAVADSIDAMSSHRAYRRALSPEQIAGEMLRGAGVQWCADVVNAAIRIRIPRRMKEFETESHHDLLAGG